MNLLDLLIAIPLCYFTYKGWKRGLIFEMTTLIGLIGGCWAATHFSTWVAEALELKGDWAMLTAFFITFVAVLVGAYFLGKCAEGILKMVKAEFLNRLVGALSGMGKCLCVLGILLSLVVMVDRHQKLITPQVKQESLFYKPTYAIGNCLTATIRDSVKHPILPNKTTSSTSHHSTTS